MSVTDLCLTPIPANRRLLVTCCPDVPPFRENRLQNLRPGEDTQLIEHIKMAALWAGERPIAEDLVQELRNPMQLRIVKAHAELTWPTFPLSDTVAAT